MSDPKILKISDPEPTEKDECTQIVVRLRRSYWHDSNGAYQRTSLRYLKRHTKGFNVFDEDCSVIGADDAFRKIVNLEKCEDGIYLLEPCNFGRDRETGHIEEWEYELLPFSPDRIDEPACDCGKIEHGRHHMNCPANR